MYDKQKEEEMFYLCCIFVAVGHLFSQQLKEEFNFPEKRPDLPRGPPLLSPLDDVTLRTRHLVETSDINAGEAEKRMLQLLPQVGYELSGILFWSSYFQHQWKLSVLPHM